jgi:hypothetical protein
VNKTTRTQIGATVDSALYKELQILAVKEGKRPGFFLDKAIQEFLNNYRKWPDDNEEKEASMTKKYQCIKPTTWQGRMVSPDPDKPVIVSVQENKGGKTILDENSCWKEIVEKEASMTKKYQCIKPTTWQGRMVSPNPDKPFIVTVEERKDGTTIFDDNPCWKEIVPSK